MTLQEVVTFRQGALQEDLQYYCSLLRVLLLLLHRPETPMQGIALLLLQRAVLQALLLAA